MIAIVNVDKNWGIGKEGALQVHISEDLKRFKEMTTGKVIIYGKNTLQTYPGKKVLPNRQNIILSRQQDFEIENAMICHSLEELFDMISIIQDKYDYIDEDFIVVGGASIYQQLIDYCSDCYVTFMNKELPADSYFPNLDERFDWEMIDELEERYDERSKISYTYRHYQKKR